MLVPLLGLAGSFTALVATAPEGSTPIAAAATTDQDARPPATITTGTPTEPVTAPASQAKTSVRAATNVSASEISTSALAAYQRAATIVNATDADCRVDWELLAAVGRIESNHGTYSGSALNGRGVATPPIIGIRLDGKNDTARIKDTDAGQYDGDKRFDRAVGPMQFIPSTWAVLGVDADGDGQRNPQDIDDAALGTAVHLCSGDGDLSTAKGRTEALLRYNHSRAYVRDVLAVMAQYAETPTLAMPTAYPRTSIDSTLLKKPMPPATGPGITLPKLPRSQKSLGAEQAQGAGRTSAERVDAASQPAGSYAEPVPSRSDNGGEPAEEPTQPGQPTDPGTEPTDPGTDPTDPGGEPTQPGEPEPTDPGTEPTQPSEPEPTEDPTPSAEPTDPEPTKPAPTTPSPSTPTPSAPEPVFDPESVYTDLETAHLGCVEQGFVDDPESTEDEYDLCLDESLVILCSLGGFGDLPATSRDESEECRATSAEYVATVLVPALAEETD